MLVLLCLEIPLGYLYSQAERDRLINAAHDEAESLAAFTELSMDTGRAARELPRRVRADADRIGGQVSVIGRNGTLITSSTPMSRMQASDAAGRPEVVAALAGDQSTNVQTSRIGGVQYLSVAVPVGHSTPPTAAVHITVPTDIVHGRVHQVWLLLAFIGLLVLAAVTGVAFAVARWTGRPIRQLQQAAVQLAHGSLSGPVTVTAGPPEVKSLAATFNQTAARLENLLTAQRAFAGEASHQLKTPLAALRLRLDNLERSIADDGRGGLSAAQTEIDRLAHMVDGLLAMARLEENAAQRKPVELEQACMERHYTWAPVFHRQGVSLTCSSPGVGPVLALPGAIEQILDNLLSNALRHSPAGTTVTVLLHHRPAERRRRSLDQHAARVELHVIDEGPGMTDEQRRRAFDRFWRAPDAPKGGSGLGLALVQRLVHASGGDVTLHRSASDGLEVIVSLPCADPLPTAAPDIATTVTGRQSPASHPLLPRDVGPTGFPHTVSPINRRSSRRGEHRVAG
ncbi:HAMP domain-containing sensor histidine kinase [Actinoplanes sp. NEAU-A12]|uniref:histidine kinase n=1 Tax=Actinoplanes sandaracinus TaxID=3045177 RepID=A0ABT6WX55_9ACTN|nr:HAMP domain-containing sensor histidine kinase [Actinoplanes sandaracinus]MDI6104326.1 HAMP domain-containing sensor histidine kinase [Actinoplanes sandaracinus]